MRRRAVRDATIRPHNSQLKGLHKSLTNADNNRLFVGQFTEPTAAVLARPQVTFQSTSTQTSLADNDSNNLIPPQALAKSPTHNSRSGIKRRRRTKMRSRCRRCGKEFASPEWAPFHINRVGEMDGTGRHSTRFLRYQKGNAPHDVCTVPVSEYEPGFPMLDFSKRLPKRKK